MIDLSASVAVESAMFLKWEIPVAGTEYLSDYNTDITIDGDLYTSIGNLLSISNVQHEIKASKSQLSIGLSGIPAGAISQILDNEIKGSNVQLFRGFFNPSTHALLDLSPSDNPVNKFKGIVTNYSIEDDVDPVTLTATSTITLTCNSIVEVIKKQVSGRRTNTQDFEGENSMDRVAVLSRSNFQFGGNA